MKLPEKSTLDAAVLERTAATARELGLSNDAAQKALEFVNQEVATREAAFLAAHNPGDPEKNIPPGDAWVKQQDAWKAAALADPDLGAGKPEQLEARAGLAMRAFDKFSTPQFRDAVRRTGFGSHPEFVKVFVKIGEAMSESSLAVPDATGGSASEAERLNALYPSMATK